MNPTPKPRPNLEPTHLMVDTTSSEDLKKQVQDQQKEAEAVPDDAKEKLRSQRVYTFPFEHVSEGSQRKLTGTFTNTAPDIRTRQAIGIMRAQLGGGQPFENLDPFTREINMIISHLTFTLSDKRPEWAKDLRSLDDVQIIYKLWEEVNSHEATFLRY